MNLCGKCGKTPRWDESLSHGFFEGTGGCFACEACHAELAGLPTPEPPTYPPGCRMPRKPGSDADLPVCGLCRVSLPYGMDKGTHLRIRPEMLEEGEEVQPGGYTVGPCCLAVWKPRIAKYLKRLCRTCGELDCEEPDHARAMAAHASAKSLGGSALL